jgi:hypothetical protein
VHKEQQDKSPHRRIEIPDRPLRQPATRAIMDEYKASVQGVDNALARLNATLASYKISGNLPKKSAADLVKESELASASLANGSNDGTQGTLGLLKHHIFQVVSKVTSEPVDWETWVSMSDAESLQKYPEVRILHPGRSERRNTVGSYFYSDPQR